MTLKDKFNSGGPSQKQIEAFLHAAELGDVKDVKKFLDKHKDAVDCQGRHGHTALMIAVAYGHIYVAELLLNRGADAHLKNDDGKSARSMAAENRDIGMVKMLAQWPKAQEKRQKKQEQEKKSAAREQTVQELLQKHRAEKMER